MKNYSQITFEFQEPTEQDEYAGVGVRIKSLKKSPKQSESEESAGSNASASQTLFGDSLAENDQEITGKSIPTADEQGKSEEAAPAGYADDTTTPETAFTEPDIILDFTIVPPASQPQEVESLPAEDDVINLQPDPGKTDRNQPVGTRPPKSNRGRKSLKTIEEGAEKINIPPDEELFKKQYYAIGEVAEMFQVNQSLLRFWETEFDIIQPRKNRKGDRHFRPIDIKNLLLIHDLLRRRKLTIEGAKDFLKKNKRSPERFAMIQSLQKIRGFLLEVRATL